MAEQRNDKFAVADAKLSLSYLFRLAAQRSFGKYWLQYSYFDIKLQFIEWTLNQRADFNIITEKSIWKLRKTVDFEMQVVY